MGKQASDQGGGQEAEFNSGFHERRTVVTWVCLHGHGGFGLKIGWKWGLFWTRVRTGTSGTLLRAPGQITKNWNAQCDGSVAESVKSLSFIFILLLAPFVSILS